MKKNIVSVSVVIAAYNAEKNIKKLTESILAQKHTSYKLSEVIVNSDRSTDSTISKLKEIKNSNLKISDAKKRLGFAGTLIQFIKSNNSDILVLLNDDVIIKDNLFLEKIIQPFIHEKDVGLVCGNPTATIIKNFISEAVRSGYLAYKNMADNNNSGNNIFTVDGKALCISRKLAKTMTFPEEYSIMGNVDKYIYFLCIKNGFNYRYVKEAQMHFKMPDTMKDFIKWQTRNYKSNKYKVKEAWGDLVEKEYQYSKKDFRNYKIIEFIKNPLGSLFILMLGFYCSYNAKMEKDQFETKWDLVGSTKNI